ncbi:MAG TPA: hypothetical protein VMX17_07810 [Candidatus Glassbacteria bacterium]|nr:hypothetical protein [Candidatus Glassbacteria bacterium]
MKTTKSKSDKITNLKIEGYMFAFVQGNFFYGMKETTKKDESICVIKDLRK